jgi:hypothetical protein
MTWLPPGKQAAVVFTIDDVHPGTSRDAYEAGGDLERGALGHVLWLLGRHPRLSVTLFTTADWREMSPFPERRLLAAIPWLRDRVYLARRYPKHAMRLDRHPDFVRFLNRVDRFDVALHGLHHCHRGPHIPIEFQDENAAACAKVLRSMLEIFERAGLSFVPGLQPPGWNLPPGLAAACVEVGLKWVASARDVRTPPAPQARTAMSGLRGVPLLHPCVLDNGLVHFPTNFQATCPYDRALATLELGGLLSIKAHIVKRYGTYLALDGLDELYCNYLDVLLTMIEDRYGDDVWFTSMDEIAARIARLAGGAAAVAGRAEGQG